jgi:hypothetical protein
MFSFVVRDVAWGSQVQAVLFPASPLANVIAGSFEGGFEGHALGPRWTRVTGWPALCRA